MSLRYAAPQQAARASLYSLLTRGAAGLCAVWSLRANASPLGAAQMRTRQPRS